MDQLQDLSDQRMQGSCAHCGGPAGTRDHAPSKILLDEPYPSNLPVVPSCSACNEGVSLDEQYVACFVECVLRGSTDPSQLFRSKVATILDGNLALRRRIERSRKQGETLGGDLIKVWKAEEGRIRNVVLKLAQCHATFELSEPMLEEPDHCSFIPLTTLNVERRSAFEGMPGGILGGWPEVGSRAMQRMVEGGQSYSAGWCIVQEERYRYMAATQGSVMIKGVLSEYLAFEVLWCG